MNQVIPNWLGLFYGRKLSFNDFEVLAIQHIPRTLLKEESGLMQTKWFDYRRLHPMQATYHFMKCYTLAYQEFNRVAVDAEKAPFMRPIKGNDFISGREKLAFWKLRQMVDKLGIPYPYFLARAMRWYVEECFRRQSLYAPRPGHITTNEELIVTIMMDWEEDCLIRLKIPADDWFRTSNFVGNEHQLAYEKFILEQINNRQHKRFSLSSAIYKYQVLRVEMALIKFGGKLVSDAIKESLP